MAAGSGSISEMGGWGSASTAKIACNTSSGNWSSWGGTRARKAAQLRPLRPTRDTAVATPLGEFPDRWTACR